MTAGTGDGDGETCGNTMPMCQMNVEPFFQCCCKCVYHLSVNYHCTTSPQMRHDVGGCCCSVQKGWACVAPDFNRVFDSWPEHSCGCELFTPKNKPQPQGAPTAEAPRCPHLQCTVDEYWNHEYGQELVKNRRILAAIRDDALANEIVQDTVLPKEAIFAYRAALLERINAKQPEPYSEERHADVGMIEEPQ